MTARAASCARCAPRGAAPARPVAGRARALAQALLLALAVNAAVFVLLPLVARQGAPDTDEHRRLDLVRIVDVTPLRRDRIAPEPEPLPEPPPEPRRPSEPQPPTPQAPQLRAETPRPQFDFAPRLAAASPVSVPVAAPPAPAPPRLGYEMADVDQGPKLVHSVRPKYPYAARSRNLTGSVTVRFLVLESGAVDKVSVLAADPPGMFEDSVLRALRLWRFSPGMLGGRPVATWVELPVRFDLAG